MTRSAHAGALEAVDRILNRGGEPQEVLGAVVEVLEARLFAAARVSGASGEVLAAAGAADGGDELTAPIVRDGRRLGELSVAPRAPDPGDAAFVERVALLISAQLPR